MFAMFLAMVLWASSMVGLKAIVDAAAIGERRVVTLVGLAGSTADALAAPERWLREAGAALARARDGEATD